MANNNNNNNIESNGGGEKLSGTQLIDQHDWGVYLFDGGEHIKNHVQSGLSMTATFRDFLREKAGLDKKYAKTLRDLSQRFKLTDTKYESMPSTVNAFNEVLTKYEEIANVIEARSEEVKALSADSIAKHILEVEKEVDALSSKLKSLEKKRAKEDKDFAIRMEKYEKNFRAAKVQYDKWKAKELDDRASKLEIRKEEEGFRRKKDHYEKSRTDYAAVLEHTNDFLKRYFHENLPEILRDYEKLEIRRHSRLVTYVGDVSQMEVTKEPLVASSLENMVELGTAKMDLSQDLQQLIVLRKTGYKPIFHEFVDLGNPDEATSKTNSQTLLPRPPPPFKTKPRAPAEDGSHLPPFSL